MSDLEKIQRIKEICEEYGVSSHQIGLETTISKGTAHSILKGTGNPKTKTLINLLNYLEGVAIELDRVGQSGNISVKEEYKAENSKQTIFAELSIEEKLNHINMQIQQQNNELKEHRIDFGLIKEIVIQDIMARKPSNIETKTNKLDSSDIDR